MPTLTAHRNTCIEVTSLGRAAAGYLQARSDFWSEVNASARPTEANVPNWDAPAVIASRITMDAAAEAYRALEGYICEDCGSLEDCACPNV